MASTAHDKCTNHASNYEIIERLDNNVHLVRNNSGATLVAKIINLDESKDEDFETFVRTICWTRTLLHRNLLPLISTFLDHHKLWTISPYHDLGSAAALSQPVGLEERQIAFIIREVLNGVEYLHSRGFIHRAINGSHILVKSDGRVCLTGMKYCTNVIKDGRWRTVLHDYPSNAHNNLKWFSPEILEQNLLGYNNKTDIYSLGVTCCELANGSVPYSHLEPTMLLLDKLTGNRPEPIDSTNCNSVGSTSQLTPGQVQAYQNRKFSRSFHSFTRDLCMADDRHRRPSASHLLNHKFIKQAKKVANFYSSSLGLRSRKSPKTDHKRNFSPVRNSSPPLNIGADSSNSSSHDVNWNF